MVSKRKIPSLSRESNPDHPIVQPVTSPYRLSYPGSLLNEFLLQHPEIRHEIRGARAGYTLRNILHALLVYSFHLQETQ
jgi:hypothetical protein